MVRWVRTDEIQIFRGGHFVQGHARKYDRWSAAHSKITGPTKGLCLATRLVTPQHDRSDANDAGVLDRRSRSIKRLLLRKLDRLLSLSIIILLGFGTVHAAIAVGIAAVASFARLTRSEVVRVRRSDYVEAAFGSGATLPAVLWRHVLPNSVTSVLAYAALQFGSALLQISTLGFLGYGAPPPTPEWGLLIAEGRNYIATAWWLTTFPGLAVVLVVLSANRISRAARRAEP